MSEEERHFYDWLKPFGFKPGTVVFNDQIAFTVDDLLDSLSPSALTSPKVVLVSIDVDISVSVVIDMARRIRARADQPGTVTGDFPLDAPDWYMEGSVVGTAKRFRLYVITCDSSHIDATWLQLITDEEATDGIIRVVSID